MVLAEVAEAAAKEDLGMKKRAAYDRERLRVQFHIQTSQIGEIKPNGWEVVFLCIIMYSQYCPTIRRCCLKRAESREAVPQYLSKI